MTTPCWACISNRKELIQRLSARAGRLTTPRQTILMMIPVSFKRWETCSWSHHRKRLLPRLMLELSIRRSYLSSWVIHLELARWTSKTQPSISRKSTKKLSRRRKWQRMWYESWGLEVEDRTDQLFNSISWGPAFYEWATNTNMKSTLKSAKDNSSKWQTSQCASQRYPPTPRTKISRASAKMRTCPSPRSPRQQPMPSRMWRLTNNKINSKCSKRGRVWRSRWSKRIMKLRDWNRSERPLQILPNPQTVNKKYRMPFSISHKERVLIWLIFWGEDFESLCVHSG